MDEPGAKLSRFPVCGCIIKSMLYYVTGNKDKVVSANISLKPYGLSLQARPFPFIEIQADSLEENARHKADQAFAVIREPLVINDTAWAIEALGGFPGIYMQYINRWFTAQDFLNLMQSHQDRTITMHQAVCYKDHAQTQMFSWNSKGRLLMAPQGHGRPGDTISTFRADQKTLAQCIAEGIRFTDGSETIWDAFAEWYQNQG